MISSPTPQNLRTARQSLDLSMAEAAALLQVDRATWWRWEAGSRQMSAVEWGYFRHVTGLERIPFRAA